MYDGYKIVCVTPAGRRRYMKILAPYILRSKLVDGYQIWANTNDPDDLAFFQQIAASDPRVRVIPSEQPVNGNHTIGPFLRNCLDYDTIYIRFDDDVVYIGDDLFEELLKFRIANPHYFFVAPLIINNALCSYTLQSRGLHLSDLGYVSPYAMSKTGWEDHRFAHHLHNLFLHKLECGILNEWTFDKQELALCHFSINCICWFGREFAAFDGFVPVEIEEEEWLSACKPVSLGRLNAICGRTLVSHFSFWPQREYLDKTDLLGRYEDLCAKIVGPDVERFSGGLIKAAAQTSKSEETKQAELRERLKNCIQKQTRWTYARSDGSVISRNIRLLPDGSFANHDHLNEKRWEFRKDALCFINHLGAVTTRYNTLTLDANNRLWIEGAFLNNMVDFKHVLIEAGE